MSDDPAPSSGKRRRFPGWRRVAVPAAALLIVGAGASALRSFPTTDDLDAASERLERSIDTAVANAIDDVAAQPARSALVYEVIYPSLVVLTTESSNDATEETPASSAEADRGLGTGVIVDDTGQILTALHVVDGASRITATFADGTQATATVTNADPEQDIAVLTTDALPEVVVAAVLGGGVRIGDETFAVGHPLGLVGSITAGVVSGLDRTVPVNEDTTLTGLIQFDAAVNPGNSGGPLLNRDGAVIGIVTALANPSEQGYFVGIGFAVPIATAGGAAGGPSV